MAQAGDRFPMPDGSVYVLRRPAAESDGAFVEMEFVLPPGCVPPPPHVHARGVEEYEVLDGRFEVVIDGVWRTLGPGDAATVPVGRPIRFARRRPATAQSTASNSAAPAGTRRAVPSGWTSRNISSAPLPNSPSAVRSQDSRVRSACRPGSSLIRAITGRP